MATEANMTETYDNNVIREDLQEQYNMISPEEVPLQTAMRSKGADNTYVEWPVVELAAASSTNRVAEGEQAPATDAGTLALRMGNYTQLSDKKVVTSSTSEAIDAAAEDIQKIAKQVTLKMRELKRDIELMLSQNIAADPGAGAGATTRVAAGLGAWLRTNTTREAGGADPTLSGTTQGYPNAAATAGTTPVSLTETAFKAAIQSCWTEGSNPSMALVTANNKTVISSTFTGASTRYKDAIDKQLVAAIDIYTSDFGELQIVPTRFLMPTDGAAGDNYPVYVLDPEFLCCAWLDPVQQKPLAETGHAKERLVWGEYTLQVDNEKAHAVIADTSGA
jgi:hypothetical protein